MMTRQEAADRIARGHMAWGLHRDLVIHDGRGREVVGDAAYRRMLAWAEGLPEPTFLDYAKIYARQYVGLR